MTGNEYLESKSMAMIEREIDNIENENQKKVVQKFVSYLAMQGIMIKTRINYVKNIRTFLNAIDKELNDISFDDYVSFLGNYLDKSSSYQIQIYTALKNFSEYLQASGITKENKMNNVKRPRAKESLETKEKREHNYLTQEEIEDFLMNIKRGVSKYDRKVDNSVRDYALFQLMLNTGLRVSAVVKLDISNIDRETNTLKVVEKRGKIRICYISSELMGLINDWLLVRIREYNPVDDALFITRKGTRLTNRGIDKLIAKYGEGIKKYTLTPHKLRATYGTMIYEKTGDIYLTQQCMGHSDIHTTMLYIRGQEEKAQKKAAEIMSKITF